MDGRQNEMAGFRGVQRQSHRFRFAHFTDHQNVRILAQRVQQRLLKTRGIPADFALPDIGAARTKGVFDGAFHRDDVPRFRQVDFLDQRRQRRRFSAAGRSAHQNQAVRMFHKLFQVRMQIQFFDRGLERSQEADCHAHATRGMQNVYAATNPLNRF